MNSPLAPNALGRHAEQRVSSPSRLADGLSGAVLYLLVGFALIRAATAFRVQFGNPLDEMWHSLPQILIAVSAGLLLLATVQIIERKTRLPTELLRKLAHVGAGMIALSVPLLFETHHPVLIVTITFTGALLISRRRGWLTSLCGQPGRGIGDILFLWAAYLMFLLAEGRLVLFLTPVLVLMLADSAAALVGERYGRTRWPWTGSGRTVEGSAAFCVVAFACIWPMVTVFTGVSLVHGMALSMLLGLTASAVEAATPRGWDNVAVPFVMMVVLELLIG